MDAAASDARKGANNAAFDWGKSALRLLTAGLFLLAVGIRVLGLGSRPLWLDEAYSAWFSARGWHELWTSVPKYEPHPPFYYSLLKLWRAVWGGNTVALESLSVVFAALTLPVVIAAVREQERQEPTGRLDLRTWIAGILAACSPMLVELGQEARPYPLLVLGYAIAILGLLRLIGEFKTGGSGNWRSWAILAAGTELTLWSHSLGILYGFSLFVALTVSAITAPADRARWRRLGATVAIVLAFYAPCAALVAARTGDWSSGWLQWRPFMLLSLPSLYTFPYESPWIALFGAGAMLILAKRAFATCVARRWSADSALLVLWLTPPLLSVAISATLVPIFLPRTLCASLIPAYLAMGGAAARTNSWQERLLINVALTAALLVCSVDTALRPPVQRWDDVSTFLATHKGPRDQIWLYPNDSSLPLAEAEPQLGQSYAFREIPAPFPALGVKGPIRAGSAAVVSLTKDQALAMAHDPSLSGVPTIWLVTRQGAIFDPDNDLPAALLTVRAEGEGKSWDYITVRSFRQPERLPARN